MVSVLHPLDVGKTRFRKLVDEKSEAAPRLPMVHTTDSYIFQDVLDEGKLQPQDCPVFFGEKLTYLFYGRPSFRPHVDEQPTSLKHYFPVCIIFKPDRIPDISRVFPFDTGAFQEGFYRSYLHSKMKLGDFGLEPDIASPGKLITLCFGTVPAYLAAKPDTAPNLDVANFEVESYLAMIHSKEGNSVDSRGSGVEVQTRDDLSLAACAAAVILPSGFADGSTGRRLQSMGIDILPYKAYERFRPNEYTSAMSTICFQYYIKMGLINENDL
jgi:hypothetical protein